MSLFENLLQMKTKKKKHLIKAVFVPNAAVWNRWAYYLYYYDFLKNSFYINDLDCIWQEWRASAINIIEQIVSLAYKQERETFESIVELFPKNRVPKIYFFYRQKSTNLIIMDNITLTPITNDKWEITGFKSPSWDKDNTQKYKEDDSLLSEI